MYKVSDNSRIVYRVESCVDGRGIYVGSLINTRMVGEDEREPKQNTEETMRVCLGDVLVGGSIDSKRHPAPQSDSKLSDVWSVIRNREKYSFGFSSITQYKKWLNKHERSITTKFLNDYLKYRLVAYKVDKDGVIVGDRQCIFKKEKAIKVAVFTADVVDNEICPMNIEKLSNINYSLKKMVEWCALTNSKDYLSDSRYHSKYYLDDWVEKVDCGEIKIDF